MRKQRNTNKKLSVEKLNELLVMGEISEHIYEMIRDDIEKEKSEKNSEKTGEETSQAVEYYRVTPPEVSCSSFIVSFN